MNHFCNIVNSDFSEILGEIHIFSFKETHLKMSAKWRQFCLGLTLTNPSNTTRLPYIWNSSSHIVTVDLLLVYLQCFDIRLNIVLARASIHWAGGRLTARSREVSKQRDSRLDIINRSEFWQAPRGFEVSGDLAAKRTGKNSVEHLLLLWHCSDVMMGAMASQITFLMIVYSTVYSGADQSKHQSSALLAFVWGIHRWPVNSSQKWSITRKMFPLDAIIMI